MEEVCPLLDTRYQLSLHIIFDLYLIVFRRIDADNGCFTRDEMEPAAGEIRQQVYDSLMTFLYRPSNIKGTVSSK